MGKSKIIDSGEDVNMDVELDLDSGDHGGDYMVTDKEGKEAVLEALKVVVDKEEEVGQETTTPIVAESPDATLMTTTVTQPPNSKEVDKEVAGTLMNLCKTLPIPESVIAPVPIILQPTGPKPLAKGLKFVEPLNKVVGKADIGKEGKEEVVEALNVVV